ncbi:DUF6931 family protein [Roseibium aggregatum]|uniref:Uncharacterized protein n=1 Tax=Roseibium aggregatum TaxID=187304 RepID=A0A939J3A4_9HYPH|nr:hypothetical protein [Roseibium aggregatum]MBN9670377.1 hypothetical protein [Roseibium aggregatum]
MASRIRFTRAKQVFETFPDLVETVAEPETDIAPAEYSKALLGSDDPQNALTYFAHVLPKREAVWWGIQCVSGLVENLSEADKKILALSETWVREGDEEARTAVHDAAQEGKMDTASAWVGLAAGWSGGSLSPNPDYRVDTPDDLTAKALNAGLQIAIGSLGPNDRDEALKSCLAAGLSFAEGGTMPVVTVKSRTQALT